MFGLGFSEILFILLIALLVLGPKKLPEVSRSLGRALGELKRTADDFRREIALSDLEEERKSQRSTLRAGELTGPPPEAEKADGCEHCEQQKTETSPEQ